jgi:hypothetical protein
MHVSRSGQERNKVTHEYATEDFSFVDHVVNHPPDHYNQQPSN